MATFKFKPPKGFVVPEHEGKTFDLVCTFEEEGDELCLTMLGKTPMPGYEKGHKDKESEEGEEAKPSYNDYAKTMVGDMSSDGGGGSGGGY